MSSLMLTCSLSYVRTTACRNFHITGEFNLDVAYDFSFEAIQPALCPEKDLGNLVDVPSVRRHQLAELSASGIRRILCRD